MFNVSDPFAQIKLIDSVEHLGLGCYFEDQIKTMLNNLMTSGYVNLVQNDGLHATAVLFRLLRQHRFMISEGMCVNFSHICVDTFKSFSLNMCKRHLK